MEHLKTTNKQRIYGRGELAKCYNPDLSDSAARKRLAQWIAFHPTLSADLAKAGFKPSQRIFTPRQVELIFEALGEP